MAYFGMELGVGGLPPLSLYHLYSIAPSLNASYHAAANDRARQHEDNISQSEIAAFSENEVSCGNSLAFLRVKSYLFFCVGAMA